MNWHLNEFFKDLKVASVAATRLPNVKKILKHIPFRSIKIFVELGPGDGVFTEQILKRLPKNSKLVLIESNQHFVNLLKTKFRDPRVEIIHGCATKIRTLLKSKKISSVDCILCGIPLSFFEINKTQKFIDDCGQLLKTNSAFVLYQALNPIHKINLTKMLQRHFSRITDEIYTFNLPPLFALFALKSKAVIQSQSTWLKRTPIIEAASARFT